MFESTEVAVGVACIALQGGAGARRSCRPPYAGRKRHWRAACCALRNFLLQGALNPVPFPALGLAERANCLVFNVVKN